MENNLSLSARIEAVLFYKGEPITLAKLSDVADATIEETEAALVSLEIQLAGRGVQLVRNGEEVMLGTASSASSHIEKLQREEISRDLGKAGLETLAIVLYKGPISRRSIDYIRGVNSQFILRNLLVRGLVERTEEKGAARGYIYKPTTELISFMGLSKLEDLPEFEKIGGDLDSFIATEETSSENT